MTQDEFEKLVAEEFPNAIPEKFRDKINNVAFLVEGGPSSSLRVQEGLRPYETLLGFYRGIPHTARGDYYGVGATMPDTITLYQNPIEENARVVCEREQAAKESKTWPSGPERALLWPVHAYIQCVRKVIRDTIWHEVAHHFGMDEYEVREKEARRNPES